MSRELELKYEATEAILNKIDRKYGDFTDIFMCARYFDTANRDLQRRKWMLRLRTENGCPVCTLKTRLADGSRGEFEIRQAAISIPALVEVGAPPELAQLVQSGLLEICGAEFLRRSKLISVPGGQIELALDSGRLFAGSISIPFREVEAELKSGADSALYRFGKDFAREFSLSLVQKSKSQRAMELAEGGTR